jgi:tRNA pseudouridine32 synthase/23S rRNA pseudouridine746 synthase
MTTPGPIVSTVSLPVGDWPTVLDCLCARFPSIAREVWLDRMLRGRVLGPDDQPLAVTHPYQAGLRVRYFREVAYEAPIPFKEQVLYSDEHLLVVDKPHFLPVVPSGGYVEQTLLARLRRSQDNPELTPLHRLDRLTAGVMLFARNAASRDAYQKLFRERRIDKFYEAVAPALPSLAFPHVQRSCLVPCEPFFRMREGEGDANSETHIQVLECGTQLWRYELHPITGRKHQLRVHMAALEAAICNDPWYPALRESRADDFSQPLQLLARRLVFEDPLNGEPRVFESRLQLMPVS